MSTQQTDFDAMNKPLIELYPDSGRTRELRGTYLAQEIHRRGAPGSPIIYASFVSSLDGRIAIAPGERTELRLPQEIVSAADFLLLQELLAQADCFITHGGYLRSIASKSLDDILHIGNSPETEYLARWRAEHGLPPQPGVVVASASLDFEIPPSVREHNQRLCVVTVERAPLERVHALERNGVEVRMAGEGIQVEADALVPIVAQLGYRSAYLIAGPRMLETMLRHRKLGRLFLTVTHQVLGGERFATLVSGPALGEAGRLKLHSLYYDAHSPAGSGQWFAQFEPYPG